MERLTIGGDLEVNRLGFGAMRITGPGIWGDPPDRDAAKAVLRRALELGVDFVDTADSYGPEVSEELIAEALHPYPDGLVIATKAGFTRPGPGRWEPDGRPEHLREACEGSLRRLRLERLDLLQLHRVDPAVPIEESVGALAGLQRQGKVQHVGLSNVDTEQLGRARRVCAIVSVQNRYSVFTREHEPVLEACARDGLAFIPFFPLGAGSLAQESALERIAARHDATAAQVAIAWLLQRSPVTLPIPGTSSVAHVEENVRAAELRLCDEDLAELAG